MKKRKAKRAFLKGAAMIGSLFLTLASLKFIGLRNESATVNEPKYQKETQYDYENPVKGRKNLKEILDNNNEEHIATYNIVNNKQTLTSEEQQTEKSSTWLEDKNYSKSKAKIRIKKLA